MHDETTSRGDTHPFAVDDGVLAGRYELGAVLGRGAKGVVHRGRDRVLRRDVAIKLLYRDGTGDETALERLRQEARFGARISHPNAVAIFDTGVHEGQPFIVMECLSGETLASRIAERRLPPNQVRDIGVQLLSALDAAHRRGIIHRDIKPANLLFSATGSVKVADFGIATTDSHRVTDARFVVGTLAYLAPERLRGAAATPQSDIYAAGVVLYEALTGRKPFEADTPASMLDLISSGSSGNLTALRPDAGATLTRVVTRALQADPTARYATASAMARALERARFARPRSSLLPPPPPITIVAAPPLLVPPPLPPPSVAAPRRRRAMAFAAIAFLATASGAGAFVAARDRGPSQPPSPGSSTPAMSGASAPLMSTTLVSTTSVAPTTTVVTTTVSTTTVSSTTRPTTTTVRSTTTRPTTTTRPATTTATTRNSRGRGRGQSD